jgi:hypothetical protein
MTLQSRRDFLSGAGALLAAGSIPLSACSGDEGKAYESAVAETWRPGPAQIPAAPELAELVRLATLAASSHNTQPWKFALRGNEVAILPDRTRRCAVVDPEDAHLYRSLGCAAENLVHAAPAQGLAAAPRYDPSSDAVIVSLEPAPSAKASDLSAAIAKRQCTRNRYDGRPVPTDALARLEQAASGAGVRGVIITDRPTIDKVTELVAEGNRRQFGDPRFMAELADWIRFDDAQALATRDGLIGRASGNPPVPPWLGKLFLRFAFSAEKQNEKDVSNLASSAGVIVFAAEADDKAAWVEAGRCYERFALTATALGMRNAFVNQPIEVRELKPQLESLVKGAGKAQLVARFGYGPEMPRSLRRPVAAVLAPS